MGVCFVIQPFDRGLFDKRFEDVIAPAITDAGLEPYRVDRDPSVSIPMEDIESGIRTADVCIAEITTDNPNVWFELGFAIASQKAVILLCSDERKTRFPFDIQHRHVIRYQTESQRDFEELRKEIATRVKAALEKREKIGRLSMVSPIADTEGLAQHEMVALVTVAENLASRDDLVPVYRIKGDMESVGFTKIAVTLALTTLVDKGFLTVSEVYEHDDDIPIIVYKVTAKGMSWLLDNQDKLVLRQESKDDKPKDNIPF